MMKVTVCVLFMLIAGVCVANQCGSCGSECASACGTRRFRACCFNYLRKKRGEANEFWMPDYKYLKKEEQDRIPLAFLKSMPDSWFSVNEFKPYEFEIEAENRA